MCRKSQIFPEDCLQSFSLNTNILRNKETLDYLWKENLKMLCQRTLTLFAVLCLSLMTSSTSLTDMHWCLCVCWWRSLLEQQKYVGFSYYAKGLGLHYSELQWSDSLFQVFFYHTCQIILCKVLLQLFLMTKETAKI